MKPKPSRHNYFVPTASHSIEKGRNRMTKKTASTTVAGKRDNFQSVRSIGLKTRGKSRHLLNQARRKIKTNSL
jgi:hypothetical protein